MFLRSPAISGTGDGSVRRSPLAEPVIGPRSFAGVTEGCCVGRAWRGRAAEESPVALASSRSFAGRTEADIARKIPLDIITTVL